MGKRVCQTVITSILQYPRTWLQNGVYVTEDTIRNTSNYTSCALVDCNDDTSKNSRHIIVSNTYSMYVYFARITYSTHSRTLKSNSHYRDATAARQPYVSVIRVSLSILVVLFSSICRQLFSKIFSLIYEYIRSYQFQLLVQPCS